MCIRDSFRPLHSADSTLEHQDYCLQELKKTLKQSKPPQLIHSSTCSQSSIIQYLHQEFDFFLLNTIAKNEYCPLPDRLIPHILYVCHIPTSSNEKISWTTLAVKLKLTPLHTQKHQIMLMMFRVLSVYNCKTLLNQARNVTWSACQSVSDNTLQKLSINNPEQGVFRKLFFDHYSTQEKYYLDHPCGEVKANPSSYAKTCLLYTSPEPTRPY